MDTATRPGWPATTSEMNLDHLLETLWDGQPKPAIEVIRCNDCLGAGKLYSGGDSFPIQCRQCRGAGVVEREVAAIAA